MHPLNKAGAMKTLLAIRCPLLFAAGCLCLALPAAAMAQNSSLFRQDLPPEAGPILRLSNTSWSYQPLEYAKEIKIHDIITVDVKEASTVTSTGDVDRKKNASINAQLTNWLKFNHFGFSPAPMKNGDPIINATLDEKYKADIDLETKSGLQFKMSVEVQDVRPNGTYVLEGHRTITINDEIWELSLTGIVRKEDVLANNLVQSEKIADLKILKREKGHVRDGYRRGWLLRFIDETAPF